MKTIYSLKEFHEKAVQISGQVPDLVSVSVDYGLFGQWEFKCYVSGLIWFTGKTMQEALQKMQDSINPPKLEPQNIDLEIEFELKEEPCQ